MSDCQDRQDFITEMVTLKGAEPQWEPEFAEHLQSCPACREVLAQELELCALLDEPLPLPPSDLISGVMARIAGDAPVTGPAREPALPWAERFAWAACGTVAMFCLDHLPLQATDWLVELQSAFTSLASVGSMPFELNGLYLAVMAVVLLAAQGAMVYQVKVSAG